MEKLDNYIRTYYF